MTNSGGSNAADNKAAEGENDSSEATTESGEISIGTSWNDIFSDSAPGEANSAADGDADAAAYIGTAGEDSEDDSDDK